MRYYAEMKRPLDVALPDVPAPDGLSIVPWSAELDEQVRLAHNEAFADHWGSEPRTAAGVGAGPEHVRADLELRGARRRDGRGRGLPALGRYEQDWEITGYSAGYTELLGVRRAWRGRQLAGALLSAAMTAYQADGIEYAELGVDTANQSGAHRLYTNLGYVVFHSSTMFAIEL